MDNRPIGIFDSGLGGLTIVSEIIDCMPNESIVYFGDSARAPYGTKSADNITKCTLQDVRFLLTQNVKMVVIACNTASACSSEYLRSQFPDIPTIDVITPGAKAAKQNTTNKKIGVIGTAATIYSNAYQLAIQKIDSSINVYSVACPLFVPLIEEGWWDGNIAYMVAEKYLSPLAEHQPDTILLGCTHYPLLMNVIEQAMQGTAIVNPAFSVAKSTKKLVQRLGIAAPIGTMPSYKYYTSDCPEKFRSFGKAILNKEMSNVQKVDIEKY